MSVSLHYPQSAESWWLRAWEHRQGSPSLNPLLPRVAALSDLFTTDRPGIFPNYFKDERDAFAYGFFFFPKNWLRMAYPLKELMECHAWRPKSPKIRVLDLGAGVGASGLSALYALRRATSAWIELHAVDHSPEALAHLQAFHKGLYASHFSRTSLAIYAKPIEQLGQYIGKKQFDLITLSFTLNELDLGVDGNQGPLIRLLKRLRPMLAPGGMLLLLESAQRASAESIRRVSDVLIAEKLCCNWGPYLHNGPCPFLMQESRFWTHEVRPFTPPPSLQKISHALGRPFNELKFSYSALSKEPMPEINREGRIVRLVSPVSKMKGHYILSAVSHTGSLDVYDIQTRALCVEDKKWLQQCQRGDLIQLGELHAHAYPNRYRIDSMDAIKPYFQMR